MSRCTHGFRLQITLLNLSHRVPTPSVEPGTLPMDLLLQLENTYGPRTRTANARTAEGTDAVHVHPGVAPPPERTLHAVPINERRCTDPSAPGRRISTCRRRSIGCSGLVEFATPSPVRHPSPASPDLLDSSAAEK